MDHLSIYPSRPLVFYATLYQMPLISLGKPPELRHGFASKAVKISCVMAIIWCILESIGRKADWLLFNKRSLSKNLQILSSNNFPNIFEQIGNKDKDTGQ